MLSNIEPKSIAVIGEVLFDHFPDGRRVLGGAPFNVAWNLKGFGSEPLFLSAIGADEQGDQIQSTMQRWGLATDGLLRRDDVPTGFVSVTFDSAGEPAYEIELGVAYDQLSNENADSLLADRSVDIVYHGSLCFRTLANRDFLQRFQLSHPTDRFVDLNLRQPWVNRDWLALIVGDCRWLKLSSSELEWVSNSTIDETDHDSIRGAVERIGSFGSATIPKTILVTCGQHGAYWFEDGAMRFAPAAPIDSVKDSVGAGDAFSAAVLHGISRHQQPQAILDAAVKFAASACTLNGATTLDKQHYKIKFDPR